jgi:hypothetical protein
MELYLIRDKSGFTSFNPRVLLEGKNSEAEGESSGSNQSSSLDVLNKAASAVVPDLEEEKVRWCFALPHRQEKAALHRLALSLPLAN